MPLTQTPAFPARLPLLATCLLAALAPSAALAQADPVRGAMLYMRTDGDTRSCLNCHGPDPGQGRNNILSAADAPTAIARAMATVGAMNFLRLQLSDPDREAVSAFLGSVSRLNTPGLPLQAWPITFDFGRVPAGSPSATQAMRLRNRSAQPVGIGAIAASDPAVEVRHDCPAQLPAGAACDIRLRMTPAAFGPVRAALTVNSPDWPSAVQAGLLVRGDAAPLSAPAWSPAQDTLALDAPGDAAVQRRIRLSNPGPMPVTLAATSIVGPDAARFSTAGCAADTVLQAGTDCEMTVTYTPSQLTTAQATVQVRSDQGHPASLLLAGTRPPVAEDEAATVAPVESGGGCSTGPGRRPADPLLAAALLLALSAAARGRRR
jgi:mono/diheme cytochrome c family protein